MSLLLFLPALFAAELHKLDARCNDGTPGAYYLEESPGSDVWLIYLPGGGHCDDGRSLCRDRTPGTTVPMADGALVELPLTTGIFSLDLSGFNVVVPHYCYSDLYGGTAADPVATTAGAWFFQGRLALEEIAGELAIPADARVVLAGSSAGCWGALGAADLWPEASVVGDGCYLPRGYAAEALVDGALTLWRSSLPTLYTADIAGDALLLTSEADPVICAAVGWSCSASWVSAVRAEAGPNVLVRQDATHKYLLSDLCVASGDCERFLEGE